MAKYKVLIVDDEPWVLDGLRDFIPWEACGFQVCGCAEDGADALRAVEALQPDLVLTDINMPGVNGLQFMKQVRAQAGKQVLFVVLSGYNRIDYMSDAMSYGIIDYLLKPLYPQDAIPVLKKAAALLDQAKAAEQKRLRDRAEQMQDDFNILTCVEHVENETRERFAAGIGMAQDDPLIPLLLRRKETDPPGCWTAADTGAVAEALAGELPAISAEKVFLMDPAHLAVLTAWTEKDAQPDGRGLLQALGQGGIPVGNLTIGAVCTVRHGLSAAFQQARLIQLLSEERINFYSQAEKGSGGTADFSGITAVLSALSGGDEREMEKQCRLLFQRARGRLDGRRRIMNCIRVLLGEIDLLLLEADAQDAQSAMDWMGRQQAVDLDEMERRFLKYCREKMAALQSKSGSDGKHIVHEIQRYVPGHLQEPLTLAALAEIFHVSPVYLGKLVKRYTGHSLATLVTQSRITEAKKLLRNTGLSVQQIARQVGFQDASYFTRKFKELENMLPSDYRGE